MVNGGARIEVLFSIVLDGRLEIGINLLFVRGAEASLDGLIFIFYPFSFPVIHGARKDNQFPCYF